MKIKDYKCKCGHDRFFFKEIGSHTGIYCARCGKWFKWANKDKLNLLEAQNVSALEKAHLEGYHDVMKVANQLSKASESLRVCAEQPEILVTEEAMQDDVELDFVQKHKKIPVELIVSAHPERKTMHWLEKKVVHAKDGDCVDDWQSCKCSACGRYDTRPYLYYFQEPNFCSWCGAKKRGKVNE